MQSQPLIEEKCFYSEEDSENALLAFCPEEKLEKLYPRTMRMEVARVTMKRMMKKKQKEQLVV